MGGSKGQSTQQTAQSQTYTPNQQAYGYLTDALSRAQQTANLPFNVPQAPVAGFSQDQQNAFQGVRNAQGMAQPYINQAQSYFSPQGAQQFYNPMADSVTAQMKNIFGQQDAQTTGQLTQAAGGVGADRIAVGQANLANQQGLAAGQTYANLYSQAVQQAQGAGYGTAALGSQAQNAALQGAQAQLGTGGLQQQLQQAQLNAPYQQQVAQAQFPYQQTQWYGNLVGGLAGGLGGTTQGTGNTTSTPAQPSIWSQILGGGLAAAGGLGQSGAFGSQGWLTGSDPSYGGGNFFSGDAYGGSGSNPLPGLTASDYGPGYAEGGEVSDQPIDIAAQPFISPGQMKPMQTHIPQLNLNPPQQSGGGGGGGGLGDIIGAAAKIMPFFLARGGSVDSANMKTFDGHDPYTFFQSRFPKGYAEGGSPDSDVLNPDEPFRMPDAEAVEAWRRGVDRDLAAGRTAQTPSGPPASADTSVPLPEIITGKKQPSAATAMAFSPEDKSAPMQTGSTPAPAVVAPAPGHSHDRSGFIDSPWAALTAAGLGIMGGTSPFAGVNIGQGGQKGLAMLQQQRDNALKDETTEQAAHRLEQEAQFHEDQYSRLTMGQKQAAEQADRPYEELTAAAKVQESKPVPMGQRIDPTTGQSITTFGVRQPDGTYKPVDMSAARSPEQAAEDDSALPANAKATQGFLIPGKNVPDNVSPEVLAGQDPGVANMVRAIDEGRASLSHVPMKQRYMVERLLHAYDPGYDETTWTLRNKQQGDLATNGTAGKMLTAVNQLLPHLSTAFDRADALANTNYPEANTIKNWWLTATGDQRVKEFATVREVAAMDAARLLRGTGQMAEKDIEAWRENIASQGSPQQLKGVLALLADDLIGARISSLQHEYRTNMRQEPPEFLSPEAKTALARIKAGVAPKAAAQSPAGGAPTAAPAQPPAAAALPDAAKAQLKEGQVTTFGNGQKWKLQNGQPIQVVQ